MKSLTYPEATEDKASKYISVADDVGIVRVALYGNLNRKYNIKVYLKSALDNGAVYPMHTAVNYLEYHPYNTETLIEITYDNYVEGTDDITQEAVNIFVHKGDFDEAPTSDDKDYNTAIAKCYYNYFKTAYNTPNTLPQEFASLSGNTQAYIDGLNGLKINGVDVFQIGQANKAIAHQEFINWVDIKEQNPGASDLACAGAFVRYMVGWFESGCGNLVYGLEVDDNLRYLADITTFDADLTKDLATYTHDKFSDYSDKTVDSTFYTFNVPMGIRGLGGIGEATLYMLNRTSINSLPDYALQLDDSNDIGDPQPDGEPQPNITPQLQLRNTYLTIEGITSPFTNTQFCYNDKYEKNITVPMYATLVNIRRLESDIDLLLSIVDKINTNQNTILSELSTNTNADFKRGLLKAIDTDKRNTDRANTKDGYGRYVYDVKTLYGIAGDDDPNENADYNNGLHFGEVLVRENIILKRFIYTGGWGSYLMRFAKDTMFVVNNSIEADRKAYALKLLGDGKDFIKEYLPTFEDRVAEHLGVYLDTLDEKFDTVKDRMTFTGTQNQPAFFIAGYRDGLNGVNVSLDIGQRPAGSSTQQSVEEYYLAGNMFALLTDNSVRERLLKRYTDIIKKHTVLDKITIQTNKASFLGG